MRCEILLVPEFQDLEPRLLLDGSLLTNGDFELGSLSGWQGSGSAAIATDNVHAGSYAVRTVESGEVRQTIATTVGEQYKYTVWLQIESEAGSGWGGYRIAASSNTWQSLGAVNSITTGAYGSDWFEVAFSFTATTTSTIIQCGYFGDPDRDMTVVADDLMVFAKGGDNQAPIIHSVSLTPETVNGLPGTQSYSVDASDPDGAISAVYWQFGDGTRSFDAAGTRTIGDQGTFTALVTVVDDENAVTTATVEWSAADAAYPALTVDPVADTVASADLTLSGTCSAGTVVGFSSDRGLIADAAGGTSWTLDVHLEPGLNRLAIQATGPTGQIVVTEKLIRYEPAEALAVTNVVSDAAVERWETLEITFDLAGSAATHTQFPYDPDPPAGMEWVDGVSVDAVFWLASDPGVTYTRPAFVYQDYQWSQISGQQWVNPTGDPTWMVRFAPPELGQWQYRIDITEAKGSASSAVGAFEALAPTDPDNHGPIGVAEADTRYFEYADGTPFTATGINYSPPIDIYQATDLFDEMGSGNENLLRWWFGGHIWSSNWFGWTSRTLSYQGNTPQAGFSVEAAFGTGLASVKLDADNPIVFNFYGDDPNLVVGQDYQISVRWRTVGLTGPADTSEPYGMALKFTGWPEDVSVSESYPALLGRIAGDTPWHVAATTFTATESFFNDSFITVCLDNTTGGAGYIDQIMIQPILPDGSLGANVLQDPQMNAYMNFDSASGFVMDQIMDAAAERNIHFKAVVEEKEDYLLNHWASSGMPDPVGGEFFRTTGPGAELHEYYWRHLIARFGASRAVMGWEFVNEAPPSHNDMYTLTDRLGELAGADGNPKVAGTSTWSGFDVDEYTDPRFDDIGYADFHAYLETTGWIQPATELSADTARAFWEYNNEVIAADLDMPTIWGEMGLHNDGESDLEFDTDGVWLHKLTWARTAPGGTAPLWWYTSHIFDNDLHHIYGAWNTFMANVPLTNGRYVDAAASSSNANLRVVGQKDLQAGRAHLWIDNAYHTWRRVIDHNTIPSQSGTVTVDLGQANTQFRLSWVDTDTGLVSSTQTVTSNGSGVISLTISNLAADTALLLAPLDETAPAVTGHAVNDGASHRSTIESVSATFSEDVQASIDLADLWLHNDTTGLDVSLTGATVNYDPATNTARWDLSALALAEGSYTAAVIGAGVEDPAGNAMTGDYGFGFFRLVGDGNGDGVVDDADYTLWADHYGQSGSVGDYNADGAVDDADYTLWADNYGAVPPGPIGGGGTAELAMVTDAMLAEPTAEPLTQAPAETPAPTDWQDLPPAWTSGFEPPAAAGPATGPKAPAWRLGELTLPAPARAALPIPAEGPARPTLELPAVSRISRGRFGDPIDLLQLAPPLGPGL